jgi:hypothetical protein
MSWRRELRHRVDEARARAMVRVARRTLKKQPSRVDRLATKLVAKATAER